MSATRTAPTMTRAEFLAWQPPDDRRYEFDGFHAVAMTGGSRTHNRICQNIWAALRSRLRGGPCEPLGPDAGVAITGGAVRYPDALVTCTAGPGSAQLIPGVVVVFEVLSPGRSGLTDRTTKIREYGAVATIQRYFIVETQGRALQMLAREPGAASWTTTTLLAEDTLRMPEIGIEIPVAELYEGVAFPANGPVENEHG